MDIKCDKCDNEIVEGSLYCDMCGQLLDTVATPGSTSDTVVVKVIESCNSDTISDCSDKIKSNDANIDKKYIADNLVVHDMKLINSAINDGIAKLLARRRKLTMGLFSLSFGMILAMVWLNRMFHTLNSDRPQDVYQGFFMFTNLTNLICSLWFWAYGITSIRNKDTKLRRWVSSPTVVCTVTAYISVVALMIALFLVPFWKGDWVSSLFAEEYGKDRMGGTLFFTHLVSFVVMLAFYFLIHNGKVKQPLKKSFIAMIYPLLYFIATIMISLYTGWYPYPFLDPEWVKYNIMLYLLILVFLIFIICFTCFMAMFIRNKLYKAWYPESISEYKSIEFYDNKKY